MKRCPKCGRSLPEGEFYRNSSRADGLDSYCKECRKLVSMAYVEEGNRRASERRRTDPAYREKWAEYNRAYQRRRSALRRKVIKNLDAHLGCGQDGNS